MEKLVLIDGNSLINRAFYATPVFTTKNGTPTNGVFGFIKLMLKIIADKQPTHFAVAFDLHAPTFRHKLYADYKAGRKPMPNELAVQIPILKDVLRIMGIKICELQGYEADDIIGTLAKKFDVQTYIYTGDRDAYQLVDDTTSVCFTRKGVSDILELNHENFKDEISITPSQIIELKALMGDKSDNIPGVAGVGEKSAYTLLEKYGDLDGIYTNLNEITGALYTKLLNGKENAYFSKELATINTQSPINVTLSDCVLKMPFDYDLKEKFVELEFKSLLGLDIFQQENTQTSISEDFNVNSVEVLEVFPETVGEVLRVLEDNTIEKIACVVSKNELRFVPIYQNWKEKKSVFEYVLSIKYGLFDSGFFDYQLTSVLKVLFAGKRRVILYNAKEVMHTLEDFGVEMKAQFDDVAILKCLSDGLGNTETLSYCLTQQGMSERFLAYGLACLFDLYFVLLNENEKKLYLDIELPLISVLFDMEKQGVCINESALEDLSARYKLELKSLTERICELAGEEFNINSTKQLGVILFEKLKIGSGVKKTKETKNYKTTAEELEKYADQSEIVREILRYRKAQKLHSTYIEGFKPLIHNGKIHTTYNQYNTATGRLSSMNPNLQNIPIRTDEGRELRKLFKASEGNVLIDADYSQIELRLLAHFSGSKELIEAYCEDRDIHSNTAAQVFGVSLDKVTASMRRAAKAVNFGIIYGISAFGLSNDLNISAKQAKEYIDKYFNTYVGVKEYMDKNVELASTQGYVNTLSGRRRVINELKSSNHNIRAFGERAAMNMPLQGSSADIIKVAMINVYNKLKDGNYQAKLVLQVHDELVIDCPKNEIAQVSKILKDEMESAYNLAVPLTVEVSIGDTWFDTK